MRIWVILGSILLAVLRGSAAEKLIRGPYLQLPTPESMVLRWRTDVETRGYVWYGTNRSQLTNRTQHPGKLGDHVVQLTKLKPATRYYYRVGYETNQWFAGAVEEWSFVTPPRPGTVQPVRIWAVGDAGTGDTNQIKVRNTFQKFAADRPADLWLMLGDNAYPEGSDNSFQRTVFEIYTRILRQAPVFPTLGNHDALHADSPTLSGPYYDVFTLPTLGQCGGVASGTEAYYSFDYANVHLVCLDSEDTDRSTNGAMARWLQADLANHSRDWLIAFFHHPTYTKGSHNSDNEGDSAARMGEMRRNFLPLLEQAGVDLVLSGHSHSYERSFLLDGHYGTSTNLTPANILNSGSGRTDLEGAYEKPAGPTPHRGAVYLVAGSSGKISGGKLNHPAHWLSLNKLGSVVIDIDGLEAQVRFLGDRGQERDYFTIRKK
jgi:3',5'-cyclic AMP phosphodiesterase CpdA